MNQMNMSLDSPHDPDAPQGTPVHLGRLTLNLNIDYIKNLIGIVRLVTLGLSFLVVCSRKDSYWIISKNVSNNVR